MTTPDQMGDLPVWKTLRLPVDADLSAESFGLARQMLEAHGDDLFTIQAPPTALTKEFRAWMWDHARTCSWTHVPDQLLVNPNAWALFGRTHVVISNPPPRLGEIIEVPSLSTVPLDDLLSELKRRADRPRMVTWQMNDILTLLRRKYSDADWKYDVTKGFSFYPYTRWHTLPEAMELAGIPNSAQAAPIYDR